MMSHNIFGDAQHGFTPGSLCMNYDTTTGQTWSMVWTIRQWCFTWSHLPRDQRLIRNIICSYDWIHNYFSDWKQQVVVNSNHASWPNILNGILQGSVMAPIIFLIFINDLPDVVRSKNYLLMRSNNFEPEGPRRTRLAHNRTSTVWWNAPKSEN